MTPNRYDYISKTLLANKEIYWLDLAISNLKSNWAKVGRVLLSIEIYSTFNLEVKIDTIWEGMMHTITPKRP